MTPAQIAEGQKLAWEWQPDKPISSTEAPVRFSEEEGELYARVGGHWRLATQQEIEAMRAGAVPAFWVSVAQATREAANLFLPSLPGSGAPLAASIELNQPRVNLARAQYSLASDWGTAAVWIFGAALCLMALMGLIRVIRMMRRKISS